MTAPNQQADSTAAQVRTVCSYCGVGCGILLDVGTGTDGRRTVHKASGDKAHPANGGRLCTKGATSADLLAATGRLTTASVRSDRSAEPAVPRHGRRDQGDGTAAARRPRPARPGRALLLRVRPADPGGAVSGQQARQGLRPHQPDRVQLPAVHGQCGQRLQAVARRGRPARLLPGLRARRCLPRHRLQHGRLPPHPLPTPHGAGQGGREADRGRSPAHGHRRQGRSVPPDQTGYGPGSAQRTAAAPGRERSHRSGLHRGAHRGLGGHALLPPGLLPRHGRGDHRHTGVRHPRGRPDDRDHAASG